VSAAQERHGLEVVVEALQAAGCAPRSSGPTSWAARCPAHPDQSPSLVVSVGDEHPVVLDCKAGCAPDAVLRALNLTWAALFDPSTRRNADGARGEIVATYDYVDEHGTLLMQVVRLDPKDFRQRRPVAGGGWDWRTKGVRRVLYHLPEVLQAVAAGTVLTGPLVYFTEGEKDADAVRRAGQFATCLPGGANRSTATPERLQALQGVHHVVVCADADVAGYTYAAQVSELLLGLGIAHHVVQAAEGKDVADHLAAGHDLLELEHIDPMAELLRIQAPAPSDPDSLLALLEAPVATPIAPEIVPTTWEALDLGALVANGWTRPTTTFLARTDGRCLFYEGRVNGLHGPSGEGKSWVAILAIAAAVTAGRGAILVDLEDHALSILDRLQALGVPIELTLRHLRYVNPDMAASEEALELVDRLIADVQAAVLVIDSVGEAMALQGTKGNDDDEVARWFRRLPRRWATLGPAVVLIDHVPKDKDADKLYAIGNQRKRAAIDGAAYRVDTRDPFSASQAGAMTITCAKDRNGTWPMREVVANAIVDPRDGGRRVHILLEVPATKGSGGVNGGWDGPRACVEAIVDMLDAAGPKASFSGRQLASSLRAMGHQFGNDVIREASEVATHEGLIIRRAASRSSWTYSGVPGKVGPDGLQELLEMPREDTSE
jgi:5S rRNA maturation endonuclease (ribonuclease M5)